MISKGSVWVDPPEGWAWGFPKIYDPVANREQPMVAWLQDNGYPPTKAAQELAIRSWPVQHITVYTRGGKVVDVVSSITEVSWEEHDYDDDEE